MRPRSGERKFLVDALLRKRCSGEHSNICFPDPCNCVTCDDARDLEGEDRGNGGVVNDERTFGTHGEDACADTSGCVFTVGGDAEVFGIFASYSRFFEQILDKDLSIFH